MESMDQPPQKKTIVIRYFSAIDINIYDKLVKIPQVSLYFYHIQSTQLFTATKRCHSAVKQAQKQNNKPSKSDRLLSDKHPDDSEIKNKQNPNCPMKRERVKERERERKELFLELK